nr:DUF3397 family protein [Marinilactibacillus kalidii]
MFYLCPLLLMIPSKQMNKFFKKHNVKIKLVDFVTPVLIVTVHVYSMLLVGFSFTPYLVVVAAMIGIILSTIFTFRIKKLQLVHFFRVWWRYVFISAFLLYIALGVMMIL